MRIKARAAYCTGCNTTFAKMHLMIQHRRTFRCGGRFLALEVRRRINLLREKREQEAREAREAAKAR